MNLKTKVGCTLGFIVTIGLLFAGSNLTFAEEKKNLKCEVNATNGVGHDFALTLEGRSVVAFDYGSVKVLSSDDFRECRISAKKGDKSSSWNVLADKMTVDVNAGHEFIGRVQIEEKDGVYKLSLVDDKLVCPEGGFISSVVILSPRTSACTLDDLKVSAKGVSK